MRRRAFLTLEIITMLFIIANTIRHWNDMFAG